MREGTRLMADPRFPQGCRRVRGRARADTLLRSAAHSLRTGQRTSSVRTSFCSGGKSSFDRFTRWLSMENRLETCR